MHYIGLKVYGKGILDFTIDGEGLARAEEKTLADYEVNEIDNVNNKTVENKQRDTLSFAFITDTHADGGTQGVRYKSIKQYIKALVEFSKYGQVDFLAHGGDVTSGAEALGMIKWKYSDLAKQLNESDVPVLAMLGNHDDNSYYTDSPNISHIFRKDDMVKRFMLNFQNGGVHDSQNPFSGYYYKDFENKKVRVVTLDAVDYPIIDEGAGQLKYHGRSFWGYGARQVDWLAHEALTGIPTGYKVIVLSHMPTRHQHTTYPEITGLIKNGQFIEEVLTACHTGGSYSGSDVTTDYGADVSVDFTEQGAREILLYVHGHNHSDTVYDNTLPYPIIGTQCAYTDPTKTGMATGTATETAWDVFNVHISTGVVDVIRYGHGDDRVV